MRGVFSRLSWIGCQGWLRNVMNPASYSAILNQTNLPITRHHIYFSYSPSHSMKCISQSTNPLVELRERKGLTALLRPISSVGIVDTYFKIPNTITSLYSHHINRVSTSPLRMQYNLKYHLLHCTVTVTVSLSSIQPRSQHPHIFSIFLVLYHNMSQFFDQSGMRNTPLRERLSYNENYCKPLSNVPIRACG